MRLAAVALASHHPDNLSNQRVMSRSNPNRLEEAGIHPPLLLIK
jgi:hypothetical protein